MRPRFRSVDPRPATQEELERVHGSAFVQRVLSLASCVRCPDDDASRGGADSRHDRATAAVVATVGRRQVCDEARADES